MIKEYDLTAKSIEKEIAYYYQKHSVDDVLNYRTMLGNLDEKERKMLYEDMEKFVSKHPNYAYLMPVRESIYELNRLEGLEMSIRIKQYEVGIIEHDELEKLLKDAYEKGYIHTLKGLDNVPAFFNINNNLLGLTLNKKWAQDRSFSDSIWANKQALMNSIHNDLKNGLIRGDSYERIIKEVLKRNDVNKFNARRLVATESSFMLNQANGHAFMKAGILRYEITAVMDSRTTEVCKGLDGEVFDFESMAVGVNYPPFHTFCRTTIVPVENDVAVKKGRVEA